MYINKKNFIKKDYLINLFLHDIKNEKSNPLTDNEEKELLKLYYSDSVSSIEKNKIKQKIVLSHQRYLFDIAKCYANGDTNLILELINVGTIGLYECFDNFDINKGYKFITYAQFYIRRAINHFMETENLIIRPSNNEKLKPKIKKIEEDFKQKNGRMPNIFEIEEILKEQYNLKIKNKSDLYGLQLLNIDDEADSNQNSNQNFTVEKSKTFNDFSSVENDYDTLCEKEGLKHELNLLINHLSKREASIIKMSYGLDDYLKPYNNIEIGEALNMTSERVRQIKKEAENKLKMLYQKVEH